MSRRRVRLALVAWWVTGSLVIGACSGETFPAPESTDPSGALYGRVFSQDGTPATRASVDLFQTTHEDKIRTGAAIVSLGLFCLVPDFCPAPDHAELSSEGAYSFPPKAMKGAPDLTIVARLPAPEGRQSGPKVVVNLRDRPDPQRVPDLTFWEPALRVEDRGARAVVAWPELEGLTHGPDTAYSVWVRPTGGDTANPHRVAGPTEATRAVLDVRPFEDESTEVVVMAETKASVDGREVAFAYRSGGHALPSVGAAPSRDRPCLVDDASGRLVAAESPCPLTDGDLAHHAEVLRPDGCSVDTRTCEPETHRRLCVDLGDQRKVSLVVFRTPFTLRSDQIRVELSGDGRRLTSVGRGVNDTEVVAVEVDPARTARIACLRGTFAGHQLRELSVW